MPCSVWTAICYLDRGAAPARVDYRGEPTLGQGRVHDKLTGDDFLRWHSLAASKLTGPAAQIQIGQITLNRGQLYYSDKFIKPNYTARIWTTWNLHRARPYWTPRRSPASPGWCSCCDRSLR